MTLPRRRGGPSRTAQAVAAARAIGLRDVHDPLALLGLPEPQARLVRALRRTIEASPTGETVVNTLSAGLAGHAALRMHAVAARSAPGSHLACSIAHPELLGRGPVSRLLSPAARGLFAGIGEPLRSTFTDDAITAVLDDAGFSHVEVTGPDDWARGAGREPLPDAFQAERLATARR